MKLILLVTFVTMTVVLARSAPKVTSGVKPAITSLNDKDARRKAMTHPAFANAGRQAGIEIWRIEDFEPVPVPQKDFGKFYKGDSYVILKTTADRKNNLSWDIHYWLGTGTSQDESGAAAILTVGLDDKFNGAAVQHREVEGHESREFMSLFQPAIRYLEGGHASGFNHVTTNAGAEKRLFQIKGKRNVRVRQVEATLSSMNKGDCFILDKDQDIFIYVGEKAKNIERLKAVSVANQIRDQDHNGRGRVEIIDQYTNEADTQRFFTALGSGSRDLVPEESAGGDDQTFEKGEESAVTLYEISDASGSLKVSPLPKPYRQEQLKPQECYILDTVSGSIYVWVGKQSSQREKSEAMTKAQEYLTSRNYPAWVHVSRVPQEAEPATFKQYFATWRDRDMAHSRLVRSVTDEELLSDDEEKALNRARIITKSGSGKEFMPDQGNGQFSVYTVNFDEDEIEKLYDSNERDNDNFGLFYQDKFYVIDYKYIKENGKPDHIIYYWIGNNVGKRDITTSITKAVNFSSHKDKNPIYVRVHPGSENKHFLKLFKGKLVIRQPEPFEGNKLFNVHGSAPDVMTVEQIAVQAYNINDEDVFVLETPEQLYIWCGQNSLESERNRGTEFAMKINGNSNYVVIMQGEENEAFWGQLGGTSDDIKVQNSRDKIDNALSSRYRFYLLSDNRLKPYSHYKQDDLYPEDIIALTKKDLTYIWLGSEVKQQERVDAHTIIPNHIFKLYPKAGGFIFVNQGEEPQIFRDLFEKWDENLWERNQSILAKMKNNDLFDNEI